VTTTAPAGEATGAVVVVEPGAVDVVVDDGRGLFEWPEPPAGTDDGRDVLVTGPVVVVVDEGSVVVAPPESAGAVVVVVEEGSVVVVVVGSGAGSVVGVVPSVVDVVSVPGPGSASPTSATAWAAGTQTSATKKVLRARARRTRLNTRISSPGVRECPPE
jgi:hypothetical protein